LFKYAQTTVKKSNRAKRAPTQTGKGQIRKGSRPEHDALYHLGDDRWLAIEEKPIIRALLVTFTLIPFSFPSERSFFRRDEKGMKFFRGCNADRAQRACDEINFGSDHFAHWKHEAIEEKLKAVYSERERITNFRVPRD